jgi:hypothetical protein
MKRPGIVLVPAVPAMAESDPPREPFIAWPVIDSDRILHDNNIAMF